SFVGLYPVPMRHGLTLGELAALVNLRMAGGEGGPGGRSDGIRVRCPGRCALSVVRTEGWRRRMLFPDTGLPWVLPSPNMPTFDTAVVYPGQVLLEGTNLSEGRGTTRPVEIFGATPIDVLLGDPAVREALESGADLRALERSWRGEIEAFRKESLPVRLYR